MIPAPCERAIAPPKARLPTSETNSCRGPAGSSAGSGWCSGARGFSCSWMRSGSGSSRAEDTGARAPVQGPFGRRKGWLSSERVRARRKAAQSLDPEILGAWLHLWTPPREPMFRPCRGASSRSAPGSAPWSSARRWPSWSRASTRARQTRREQSARRASAQPPEPRAHQPPPAPRSRRGRGAAPAADASGGRRKPRERSLLDRIEADIMADARARSARGELRASRWPHARASAHAPRRPPVRSASSTASPSTTQHQGDQAQHGRDHSAIRSAPSWTTATTPIRGAGSSGPGRVMIQDPTGRPPAGPRSRVRGPDVQGGTGCVLASRAAPRGGGPRGCATWVEARVDASSRRALARAHAAASQPAAVHAHPDVGHAGADHPLGAGTEQHACCRP